MNIALTHSIRPAPASLSRLFQFLAALALLFTGGTLSAQTITRYVVSGGTLDISPISSIYPPGDYARMMVMHTTVPGTSKGTMWKTILVDEYAWGTGGANPFGPALVSPFTQNRITGSQGFRYKANSNAANIGTSESIPIRFSNLTGTVTVNYTLKINIVDPALAPQITQQPIPLQSVPPASGATMSVVAASGNNSPLTYQWYEGHPPGTQNPIGGATGTGFWMPPRQVGQYHFWVRVSNNITSVNSLGATVNVSNPPTANIGGPYVVGELETITLSALNSSDPDSPFLAYQWDNDNNNIFGLLMTLYGQERVGTPSFTAVDLEGPGTHPLSLQVYDQTDMMDSDSTLMTIVNSPPRAVFSSNGAPGQVTFSNFVDSPGDLAAGFQFSYDLDNDGTFEIDYSATPTATVPAGYMAAFLNGGQVRGRIRDRDDGVSEYIACVHGRGVLVTTLTDENNGGSWEIDRLDTSLREAIDVAQSDATPTAIYFDPALLTTLITPVPCSALATISTHVIIYGPEAENGVALTGSAAPGTRGFAVTAAGTLALNRVTLTNFTGAAAGSMGKGGAISSDGTLIVRRCTLHGNRAAGSSLALGGAIYSGAGTVTLENSTFFDNKTTLSSGIGFSVGGAVYASNTVLTVTNCTVTGNTANDTRGIVIVRDPNGTVSSAAVNNCIIADAVAGSGLAAVDFAAVGYSNAPVPVTSGANNIMRNVAAFAGSFTNVNPGIAGLTINGGPTFTMSPAAGSPAINRGAPIAGITTDQRGYARPYAKRYDIGAVEFDGLNENLVVTTVTDEDDGTSDWLIGAGTSLREALIYAGEHAGEDTITFHASLGGQVVKLGTGWNNALDTSALRVINQTVTVEGLNTMPGIAIGMTPGTLKRHFVVESGGSLTLSRVHLGAGHSGLNGGCVWSAGSFRAMACAFTSNTAAEGGAIYADAGSPLCHLENCTFTANTATGTGSAVSAGAAQTILRHLTVNGNTVTGGNGSALVFKQTQAELCNSLVLGNTGDGIGLLNGAALNAFSTNNILGGGGTGGLVHGANGNLTGIHPAVVSLGALDFNGAATPTMALGSGSIAVNQAVPIAGLSADQRGTARPTGPAPDIGAYEDTTDNGAGDADFDTVSNMTEYLNDTGIFDRDSDSDGYNDATEFMANTDPTSSASIPPANHIECVLGADPGLGLDLDGTFTHAVNIGPDGAAGVAGTATFTADNAAGVSVSAFGQASGWYAAAFGSGTANATLAKVFGSHRSGLAAQPVNVTLSGLTPGRHYKLQLLFGEACCPGRTFDVIVGGALAVDNFMPANAQGGAGIRYAASAIVHEFTAMSSTLPIVLSSANVPAIPNLNTNPLLSGLTLEQGSFVSAFAEWCYLHGLPYDGSHDLANPSGDGVSNLLKFAFNLAPQAGDLDHSNVTVFAPGEGSGLPAIQPGKNGAILFDFLRRTPTSAPEVSYIPRISTDLVVWQPVSLDGATITSVHPGWERVTLTIPALAGSRLFGRVEITHTN